MYPYPKALEAYPKLRQSTLSQFDNCSLSSDFERRYATGWSHHHQARGTIFHRFAAEALREMNRLDETTIPVDAALGIMRDVLRQDDVDRFCPLCGSTEILPGISALGMRTCRDGHQFETDWQNIPVSSVKDLYWVAIKFAKDTVFDGDRLNKNQASIRDLVDVELRLEAELYYLAAGVRVPRILTGQIDALFVEGTASERAVINDWKDTWGMPPESEVSEDGYFQQRFYAWLIFRRYPSVNEVVLRERYVRYSEDREAKIFRSQEPEIEGELAALTERFDRSVEEALFTPSPGKHCSFCARPGACPIPRFARDEGAIETAEQAEKASFALIVADETQKRAKKNLKAWVDVNGPVRVKDAKGPRVIGFKETERRLRPSIEDIQRAEIEAGRKLSSEELEALYRVQKSTRFGVYVPEKLPDPQQEATEADEFLQQQLLESIEKGRDQHGAPADDEEAAA